MPAHRAAGDDQPVGQPTCVGVQPLGDGLALAVVADDRHRTYPVPLLVDGAIVRRALPGDGASEALVALLTTPETATDSIEVTTWHHDALSGERGITVDQTNESVIVGERAMVKWTFLADAGPHPAPTLLTELQRGGFTGTPRPWGAIHWRPPDGSAPRLLALVVDFIPGAVDGWTWLVDDLQNAVQTGDLSLAAAGARDVGRLVADFHQALAHTARPATHVESAAWRTSAQADLSQALEATRGDAHRLLAGRAHDIRAVFDAMPTEPAPVIRVHGDLHVGQVLRHRSSGDDLPSHVLTDFDGNPVVAPKLRLAPQPAALDAAGMAQSFVHAGLVTGRHHPELDADALQNTIEHVRTVFLDAYTRQLGARAEFLDRRLLRPFALQQICREFTYAASHLPRWSYVPEAALPILLERNES